MNHTPVLLTTVLDLLDPKEGETVIDVTVGLGGHASGFLERIGSKGKLIGMDADEENVRVAGCRLKVEGRDDVMLLHANFRDIATLGLQRCDILFADLGLSSPHVDDPSRGFSFRAEGPLDCRYDRSQGVTAAGLIQKSPQEELVKIFQEYGEVRRVHTLVQALLAAREKKPIATTTDLVEIVQQVYGWQAKKVFPQIFQALRIAINDEMGALNSLLEYGPSLLNPDGRMGVISYHSLEDRKVKRRFQALTKHTSGTAATQYKLLTKKPIKATLAQVENNPRARSARFRAIQKI